VAAVAKDTQGGKFDNFKFMESPPMPAPTQPGGSMFVAAQANTTILGWWQFDTASGQPDAQGWTSKDMTTQTANYYHVDGPLCPASNSAEVYPGGNQHMWCGQWATTTAPWCGWMTLPGYGNGWDQSLISNVIPAGSSISWACSWDSEPNYDDTSVQWWDDVNLAWVSVGPLNGANNYYDGLGTDLAAGPYADGASVNTQWRFYSAADGGWSDEDGLWPTTEGMFKVDDINVTGSATNFEDWDSGEICYSGSSSPAFWTAVSPAGYGDYSSIKNAVAVVQEDPCSFQLSHLWTWFDDPNVTNYACGGWALQGAMPYGPNADGLYMHNEIWSPLIANAGSGSQYQLEFLTYRDLPLDNLQFYTWGIAQQDLTGCMGGMRDHSFVYYGGQKDWLRTQFEVGSLLKAANDSIQIAIGAIDMCSVWCGVYGTGACHSHAPLMDQVKLKRIDTGGPQWNVRHIDLFADNFPEDSTPTGYARADGSMDILPNASPGILPGDSIVITVTNVVADPIGTPYPPTIRPSVFCFAQVQDRWGNDLGVAPQGPNGMESPDQQQSNVVPRYPYLATGNAEEPPGLPAAWHQFRFDYCFTTGATPNVVPDRYCFDFMDVARAYVPPEHPGDDPGNLGCFLPSTYGGTNPPVGTPGHVIRYFFGAYDAAGNWTFWHRQNDFPGSHLYTMEGQTFSHVGTLQEALDASIEFSILPDAGNIGEDGGDILFVDDCDDRGNGAHAQYYFDTCFFQMGILDRVDRYDVIGPSSVVGNSLAARVKNTQSQLIGDTWEIYQKILWNTGDLSRGLVGDGGPPNGGSGADKSMDWTMLKFFMDFHPSNPGNFFAGDDLAEDWIGLTHIDAINFRAQYMQYALVTGDHNTVCTNVTEEVYRNTAQPIGPDVTYAFAGCPAINDFDVMTGVAPCFVNSSYETMDDLTKGAKMIQAVPNFNGTTARCVLEGFAFDAMRDDVPQSPMDRCLQLADILRWFQNILDDPVGIDPVAFENSLSDNYPNPFNPTTTIKYSIAGRGHVSLKIYNAAGQLVRTLVDDMQAPTQNGFSKIWNGLNNQGQPVSSGVYFYKLVTTNFTQTKKMVLLK
jgi:hypothetical protein